METDRGCDVKKLTDDQPAELIDQSLKATANDVREGRIPLDGRARLPLPKVPTESNGDSPVPSAAE
jgi:hypothetical protein